MELGLLVLRTVKRSGSGPPMAAAACGSTRDKPSGTSRREEAARVEAEKNLGRGRDLWIEEQWRAMVGWWLKSRRGGFGSGKIPGWKERPGRVAAR